jgi:hypothetical protein
VSAPHDFVFALEFSNRASFARMLSDLATAVASQVGLSAAAAASLAGEVAANVESAGAGANARGDVSFRCGGGELEITVTRSDGSTWRASRHLS